MPGKTDLSELNCSLARTLEVVGDWWTLLIVRDAFLGVRRFGDFQKSLGIAKNILAARLSLLFFHLHIRTIRKVVLKFAASCRCP